MFLEQIFRAPKLLKFQSNENMSMIKVIEDDLVLGLFGPYFLFIFFMHSVCIVL